MPVNGVGSINFTLPPLTTGEKTQTDKSSSVSFSDYLNTALNNLNNLQIDAEQAANDFAAGKTDNIHGVMVAAEKADLALQFALQVRNKVLEAYNEIMRVQV